MSAHGKPDAAASLANPKRQKRLIRFLSQPLLLEEAGPPGALLHLLLAGSFAVAGFIAWAAFTEMKETALTHGQIMPAGSVHVVQHLEGGIVAGILVQDGQVVEQGEPLLRLEAASALAELEQLQAREAALALKAERLRAFVLGHEPDFSAGDNYADLVNDERAILRLQLEARANQQAVLLSRVEQRRAELKSLAQQRENVQEQIDIITEQAGMRRRLMEKGLVSKVAYLESERALSKTVGELTALIGQTARTEEALAEAQNSLVELDSTLGNEALNEMGLVGGELAQIREQLTKLEDRVARLEITAPVRGVVKGLVTRTVGGVIAPGDILMEIVPFEDKLVAEVRIEPRDVGHLRTGQNARVKVTTYDVARFGAVEGQLERISASTFSDEEGAPYYKGVIALARNHVGETAGRNPILPGMVVDVDISTGSKSLLRYLLKPVYRSLETAFTER